MHKLHVKIDNQAFLFTHMVEQVQLFKWEQPTLTTSPSQSEIVRGEKVTPIRRQILTLLVNSEVLWIKKMSKIHVWKWWRSLGCCVSVCGISFYVLFQSAVSFWWMHMQSFESDYTRQNGDYTHTEMWSCAGMHWHMDTQLHCDVLPDTHVYYLVLGNRLSCRSEVAAVGFHG